MALCQPDHATPESCRRSHAEGALVRVRDVTLDALNNADVPFEVLMDEMAVRSVNGRNPLSQFYFFYQLAFLRPRELNQAPVSPLPDFGLGTHFELQMGLLERVRVCARSSSTIPTCLTRQPFGRCSKITARCSNRCGMCRRRASSELQISTRRQRNNNRQRCPSAEGFGFSSRSGPADETEKKTAKDLGKACSGLRRSASIRSTSNLVERRFWQCGCFPDRL